MTQAFTTVAVFTYSSEAKIMQGRLEAEGIPTFLFDDLIIDTDPLVSNAIGGVKLRVDSVNAERAQEILKSISEYSLDNAGKAIECPNCEGNKITYASTIMDVKSLFHFIFGFLISVLPFYTNYEYTCQDCNHKFS
ncbi:MAG: DNA-directed RNA polymerase subunit RPC12/RpoP [Salibacteraceae bacterium]|jgi:DNA-directed RNA polymerase subunit RPC12/RpoP